MKTIIDILTIEESFKYLESAIYLSELGLKYQALTPLGLAFEGLNLIKKAEIFISQQPDKYKNELKNHFLSFIE